MKKVLLVVAMLVIAAPAMATVSVTATDLGSGVVQVGYSCSAGERVRSFALDITVDSGLTIDGISNFKVGESNAASPGYGIFPGSFAHYINATSPNWGDVNYTPIAPSGDANRLGGLTTSGITVELGSLYVGDVNKPPSSGTLFRLAINAHGAGSGNLSMVANNTRVGCVLEDTNVITPVLTGTTVTFLSTYTISGQVVGAAAPRTGGIGGVQVSAGGITVYTDASGYYSIDCSGPGTCTVSDPNSQWTFVPASWPYSGTMTQNVTGTATECMNKLDAKYTRWVSYNKPDCWCYQKQCKGDADGANTLGKPIAGPDLTIFKAAVSLAPTSIKTCTSGGKPCICADFDRTDTLGKPVAGPDLTIFKSNVGLAATVVPQCPSDTINAWKN
jgi:hypothetical protein